MPPYVVAWRARRKAAISYLDRADLSSTPSRVYRRALLAKTREHCSAWARAVRACGMACLDSNVRKQQRRRAVRMLRHAARSKQTRSNAPPSHAVYGMLNGGGNIPPGRQREQAAAAKAAW